MSRKSILTDNSRPPGSLSPGSGLCKEDRDLFERAWKIARANHGDTFTFYLPGMIRYSSKRGRYPAISITGEQCDLLCEHCKGKLLKPMLKAKSPDHLIDIGRRLARNGDHGILLTGGSNKKGVLPWDNYLDAIRQIKEEAPLFLSSHTGFPDLYTALSLRCAGVKQALVDVMGDENTATQIYHLPGLRPVKAALDALDQSGLELVPHIVAGLNYGKIQGEYHALEIISDYRPKSLVIVVVTPLEGTPMAGILPPNPLEVARLIARARLMMPEVPISLGCERPRNRKGWHLERLAIRAGVTRMAIWSEYAIAEAESLGLSPRFQATCCSLDFKKEFSIGEPYKI